MWMREEGIIHDSDQIYIELKDYLENIFMLILWHESFRTHGFHLLVFTLDDSKEESSSKFRNLLSKGSGPSIMNVDASGQASYARKRKQ